MAMRRTTIMAEEDLLEQLRQIARDEGISLGEVIRQGLEWRIRTRRRVPSFIGAVASEGVKDASRDEEIILEYVREKDERRRRGPGL
jgi:Ribbon-helix-helix protein, copG family